MGKDARYIVRLDDSEGNQLREIVDQGRHSRSVRQRARVLLKADQADEAPAWVDTRVAEFAEVSVRTVERVRRRFVEEGFEASVFHKASTDRLYRKLDGAGEARLIATACSDPPAGHSCWTLRMLADSLVALEVVESISHECVRTTLKKTNSSRI